VKLKLIPLLLLPALMLLVACGGTTEPTTNMEALAALPTPTPEIATKKVPTEKVKGIIVDVEKAIEEDLGDGDLVETVQFLESLVAPVNELIAWPHDFLLSLEGCGGVPNAFYYPDEKRIVMCVGLAVVAAQALAPWAEDEEHLILLAEGVWAYFTYHEIGHALIDIFELPPTGREEDAVDQLAALVMLGDGDSEGLKALDAAIGFFKVAGRNEAAMGQLPFWDEHSLSLQRAYDLMCMAYGYDQSYFSIYLKSLPQERAQGCVAEYERINGSWDTLLEPYLK
jgi:hypothetical protein